MIIDKTTIMKRFLSYSLLTFILLSFSFSSKRSTILGTYHLGVKYTPSYNTYLIHLLRGHKYSMDHKRWIYSTEQITKIQGKWEQKGDSIILRPVTQSFWHSKHKKKEWKLKTKEDLKESCFTLKEGKLTDTENSRLVYTKD